MEEVVMVEVVMEEVVMVEEEAAVQVEEEAAASGAHRAPPFAGPGRLEPRRCSRNVT